MYVCMYPPPYRPTPSPAHEKRLNQRAPGGLGPP